MELYQCREIQEMLCIGKTAVASREMCQTSETDDWQMLHQKGSHEALGIIPLARG